MTATFNASDAASMVALAALTELDLSDLFLDSPWNLIRTFSASSLGDAQGFVAMGPLPSAPSTNVCVVAIGASWPDFVESYLAAQHSLGGAPDGLFPVDTPGVPMADLGYSLMYDGVRGLMWNSVLFAKRTVLEFKDEMPLVVAGLGPGAPLAQFAAVDLLPGHQWNGNTSPITSVTAYTFSNVAFVNADFASAFEASVPAAFATNLATNDGVVVDFYPTVPNPTSNGYRWAVQPTGASAKIPQYDCPWIERGSAYYQQMLLGSTLAVTSAKAGQRRRDFAAGFLAARRLEAERGGVPAETAPPPSPYSSTLAYTLTLLDLAAYRRAQHPDLPLQLPAPYVFARDVNAAGVNWGSIFVSPDRVVVSFRGTLTWQDTVDAWGAVRFDRPSWLTLDGRILASSSQLYQSLRDDLRQKLAAIQQPNLPLVISGHDSGGPLASQAMLDLTLNPVPGAPAASAVYTFGASPFADIRFVRSYDATVGANSFQVARPADVIPSLMLGGGVFNTLPALVRLDGGVDNPANGSTFHPLTIYSQLLDPQGSVLLVDRELTQSQREHYQEGIAHHIPENTITRCALDTANEPGGRLTFSWESQPSPLPPKRVYDRWTAYIGAQQVIVRPGHEMVVEAPHGEEVHLVLSELVLSPGSRLRIATKTRLYVSRLTVPSLSDPSAAAPPPEVYVVGADGGPGSPGVAGADGSNGGPQQPGGNGSHGGSGGVGTAGANCPQTEVRIDTIEGNFLVFSRGGLGGAGGSGGAGGNGGAGGGSSTGRLAPGGAGGTGGTGGNGGDGGDGATITIIYRTIAPGAEIHVDTPPASGGPGGRGGPGGAGGRGQPAGPNGAAGAMGTPGRNGIASKIEFIQRQD